MGWSGGNTAAEPVIEQLITEVARGTISKEAASRIVFKMVRGLRNCDWDTEDEVLRDFRDEDFVVNGFLLAGVALECQAERQQWPV